MREKFYHYLKKKTRSHYVAFCAAAVLYQLALCYYGLSRRLALAKPVAAAIPAPALSRQHLAESYYLKEPRPRKVQREWSNPSVDLSIMMVVGNAEPFLRAALESAFNQKTKYRYEVIALSANSTDGSKAILEEYRERLQPEHYADISLAEARNRILQRANGSYVTYFDADDLLREDAVETWLNAAEKHQADLVQCSHYTFDEKGVIAHFDQGERVIDSFEKDDFLRFPGYCCMKIFRRSLFAKTEFPKDYRYEDTIMAFLIYPQVLRAVSLSAELYGYRQHGASHSRSPGQTVIDTFWIVEQLVLDIQHQTIRTDYLNHLLLHQLGPLLYNRMRNEGEDTLRAVFSLACELLSAIPLEDTFSCPFMKDLLFSFKERNFALWKLSSNMI